MRFIPLLLLCTTVFAQSSAVPVGGKLTSAGTLVNANFPAATPPMGVNLFYPPWESTGSPNPTEAIVKAQADALVSTGLLAKGYKTVSVDEGWQQCASGSPPCVFEANPTLFPDGMAATAAYVHADGALLELYGSPGQVDCSNSLPGQYQNEVADANLMASWNIDSFKSDYCTTSSQYGTTPAANQAAFAKTINALNATGHTIPVLVNAFYGYNSTYTNLNSLVWGGLLQGSIGGNRVRIGYDNGLSLWSAKYTGLTWSNYAPYQVRGYWLDPDYLMFQLNENGNGTPGSGTPVTDTEARAQFNAYAMTASPLISGQYITALNATNLATLGNAGVIAVDQDSTGLMGSLAASTSCGSTVCQVWMRKLTLGNPDCTSATTGCMAVAFINFDSSTGHSITANWSALGISGTWNICDLWASIGTCTSEGSSSSSYTYSGGPAWGSTMVILTQ